MLPLRSRALAVGPAIVIAAVLAAGCGGSSGGHQAGPTTTPSTSAASTPASKPPATTARPTGTTHPTATTRPVTTTTLPKADLAALEQQLDAAGSSLGGAGAALAQADPNQTKNAEGSTP